MSTSLEVLESHPTGWPNVEHQLSALREALEALSANQDLLKKELKDSSNNLEGLDERLRASLATEISLKVRIENDAQKIAELNQKLLSAETTWKSVLEKQTAAAEQTRERLAKELESLKANKASVEESLRSRIDSDTAKIADLRDKLSAAEIAVADTSKMWDLEEQTAAAQNALTHLKEEIETLKVENAALGGKTEKAEKLLEQVRKDAAAFAGEAHDLKSKILSGEAALTASNEQVRLGEQREKTLRQELKTLNDEVLTLRTELSECVHALAAERAKVKAMANLPDDWTDK